MHLFRRAAVVEVVEDLRGVLGIGADDIIVAVVESGSAEQILHRLIVHAFVRTEVKAEVQRAVLCQVRVQSGGQTEGKLVVVVSLLIIHSVGTLSRSHLVGVVQTVPVDLSVCL